MKRLVVWGMRFLFLLGVGLFLCPTVQYVQEECIPVLSENYQNYQIEKEINNVTLDYIDSSHISVRGKSVSLSEEFLKVYEKEKGYDERADEPTEHFAYSYTSYLSKDEDTISRIPETKKFYDTYHSYFQSLGK